MTDGTSGSDRLSGTSGADVLRGLAGDDTLLGGDGDDSLYGDEGNDALFGGAGDDSLFGGLGNDQLQGSSGNDVLDGGEGSDRIFGEAGDDRLSGGAGNDLLQGGDGNDRLDGGPGADRMFGEASDDIYVVDNLLDFIYDPQGNNTGTITVDYYKKPSGVTWTLAEGVKPLPYWIDSLVDGNGAVTDAADALAAGVIKYAFPTTPLSAWNDDDKSGFTAFNEAQQAYVKAAFAYIETIINVRFQHVADGNQPDVLSFANNAQKGSAGYATGSLGGSKWAVFLNNTGSSAAGNLAPRDGLYAALTIIHEIGHALGLKHPHSETVEGLNPADGPFLTAAEDRTAYTQLSYNSTPADYEGKFRVLDIAALQYLYGPAKVAGTGPHQMGDNSYALSTSTNNFIWDGGGTDTLDASAAGNALTLSLEAGARSYFGAAPTELITAAGQITINFGTQIENALGTAFDDSLTGNGASNSLTGNRGNDTLKGGAGDDVLVGGAGNDLLDGGTGIDTARYTSLFADVSFTLDKGVLRLTTKAEGVDSLTRMDLLAFADRTVSMAAVFQDLVPQQFRLIAGNGFVGTIGGAGSLFGADGVQDISLVAATGAITLDPSFNLGGDIIRLPENASAWTIQRSGSAALLFNGTLAVSIPVGTQGLTLVFADGARTLAYTGTSFAIGAQSFAETPVEITALGSGVPAISATAGVAARLILAENGSAKIGGNVSIIGTASGKESVTSLGGTLSFDPSFNAGGDSITLPGKLSSYAAKASGSSMLLTAGSSSYLVPVGTTGATLVFDDAFRTLLYGDGQFKIGGQVISGTGPTTLFG